MDKIKTRLFLRALPIIVIAIILLSSISFLITRWEYIVRYLDPHVEKYPHGVIHGDAFSMSPDSLLSDIDQGKPDLYKPLPDFALGDDLSPHGAFSWSQDDFLKVARSFHRFYWKESLDGWETFSMDFSSECDEHSLAIDEMTFIFYRPLGEEYQVRGVRINLLTHQIFSGSDTLYRVYDWKNIAGIKVEAADALETAEDNGGRDIRLAASNQCSVVGDISSANSHGWIIEYWTSLPGKNGTIFSGSIDPYTRRFKVYTSQVSCNDCLPRR